MNAIVGTWLLHLCKKKKSKKGAFTNSNDPDETQQKSLPKINIHNCWDVVIAFMQKKKKKKGNIICCVSSGSVLFVMFSIFLVMVDNIKSYMILDLFHFFNVC